MVSIKSQADQYIAFRPLVGVTEATMCRGQNKSFHLVTRKKKKKGGLRSHCLLQEHTLSDTETSRK